MARKNTGLGGSGKGQGNGKPASKPAKKPVEKQENTPAEEPTEEPVTPTAPVDQSAFNRESTPEDRKKNALELARKAEAEKKRKKQEKFEKSDNCIKCIFGKFKKDATSKSKGKCYRNPPTGNGALGVEVPASHWCGEFPYKNDK